MLVDIYMEWLSPTTVIIFGVAAAVLAAVLVIRLLQRRRRVVCPGDLSALRDAFAVIGAEAAWVGPYLAVRKRYGLIPVEVRVDCRRGTVSTRGPWPLALVLLFVPHLAFAAFILLLWIASEMDAFEKEVRDLLKAAAGQ
ncbi:hypothetical protein Pisl_1933 [Pyrobaculum islandicum DSM 4184]|uniref:Uncharacterized protein n=1 Tax=Pyrobaculum islandicum (strain DSM 4184 / JCM 9189 / GEO3) TaxID=384616 RepID=A1RVU8_PYRIL|nr:hypothetical protein [Pyrobaculum islandicum]ABL89080.1 hypothetical protein Pisl_1933 [Pyrobaculum islandicum DSM 4184]